MLIVGQGGLTRTSWTFVPDVLAGGRSPRVEGALKVHEVHEVLCIGPTASYASQLQPIDAASIPLTIHPPHHQMPEMRVTAFAEQGAQASCRGAGRAPR
jgi:hypothetical protein